MDLDPPNDDKYIVFNREQFFNSYYNGERGDVEPLADAVVIRRQDAFAAVAFRAYAGAIVNALEVIELLGAPSILAKKRLFQIVDYFTAQAEMAEFNNKKVPD